MSLSRRKKILACKKDELKKEGFGILNDIDVRKTLKEKLDVNFRKYRFVEPVFANLRIHKRLDRFTLRGRIKVNIQWMLYCMVHNIEKIANYGFA
jgi:hypothetical protein